MVPGQVITQETIDFMRKLDVKEIHGYDAAEGLKLIKPDALGASTAKAKQSREGRSQARVSLTPTRRRPTQRVRRSTIMIDWFFATLKLSGDRDLLSLASATTSASSPTRASASGRSPRR